MSKHTCPGCESELPGHEPFDGDTCVCEVCGDVLYFVGNFSAYTWAPRSLPLRIGEDKANELLAKQDEILARKRGGQ